MEPRGLPLLPPESAAAYIAVEGPSGVGKSTFVGRIPPGIAVTLPEYADASELLGTPIGNPRYPRSAGEQAGNEQHFAHQELHYWHTCSARTPETAASLLADAVPIVRDRSFLGSVAFSYACALLLGWGDRKDALGSYRELLSAQRIPCPSHLLVLTGPLPVLQRRLLARRRGHPVWVQPALLRVVTTFCVALATAVYEERSLVDESGSFDPVNGIAFINRAAAERGGGYPGPALERLLMWEPPLLPAPPIEEVRALERALNERGETVDVPMVYARRASRTSFAANPHPWRLRARALWRKAAERAPQAGVERELPDHFVDRHAYLLFRNAARGTAISSKEYLVCRPQFDALAPAWVEALGTRRTGSQRLSMPPPPLEAPVDGESLFRATLLKAWRDHLRMHGVPVQPHAFRARPGETWGSLYRRSVHYPMRLPAILGPSFFDRLAPASAKDVLARFGRENIWRLYAFLLQVHEESHLLQSGEPMLGEVALAHLWCSFLDERDLWCWQRVSPTGPSFNIELPWVRQMPLATADAGALFRDTHRGVHALFASASAYDVLCEGAWQFDHGAWRYSRYLDFVVWCISHRAAPNLEAAAVTAGWLEPM
jgi:hypothetical protein